MSKPKVLVCILTGIERQNWISPDLCMNLVTMVKDPRFEVNYGLVRDSRPWEAARNYTNHAARSLDVDWLISCDNDNFVPGCTPLDIIQAAGTDKHVIGLTYAIGGSVDAGYHMYPNEGHYRPSAGAFREVSEVGGGVLMIHKTIWKTIPRGPWFRFLYAPDSELHLPRTEEAIPEDKYFCNLVRQNGFKVWTHAEQLAGHYRTTDITQRTCTLAQLSEQAKGR